MVIGPYQNWLGLCNSQTLIPDNVEEVETHGDSEVAKQQAYGVWRQCYSHTVSRITCVSDVRKEMYIKKELRT